MNKKFKILIIIFTALISIPAIAVPQKQIRHRAQQIRPKAINYQGAGVLPVAVHRGKLFAALAQEAFGKDAGTFADFGGGKKPKDQNNPKMTAAREWAEEGLVFGSQNALFRLLSSKSGNVIKLENSKYPFYIVKVNFDPNINKKFLITQSVAIKNIKRNSRLSAKQKRGAIIAISEKKQIVWVPITQLLSAIIHKQRAIKVNGKHIVLRKFTLFNLRNAIPALKRIK